MTRGDERENETLAHYRKRLLRFVMGTERFPAAASVEYPGGDQKQPLAALPVDGPLLEQHTEHG